MESWLILSRFRKPVREKITQRRELPQELAHSPLFALFALPAYSTTETLILNHSTDMGYPGFTARVSLLTRASGDNGGAGASQSEVWGVVVVFMFWENWGSWAKPATERSPSCCFRASVIGFLRTIQELQSQK
jgi:hypothetical protein